MKFELKWLAWEMTRRCNLQCIHCRSSCRSDEKTLPDFSTSLAYKVIDDIAAFSNPVIVLTGGEPLLRDDIFDIAEYGSKKGLRMCLATNGTLINEALCEKIKSSGIKMVSLSLDGATAEIHDDFRKQPGAFDATLHAARYFAKHEIDFLINSSFTKRNQQDIANCFHLAKKLGAKAWYLFMVVPAGRGNNLLEELISSEDYQEILDWHVQIEQDEKEILMRPTCAPHYYRIRFEHAKEKKAFEKIRNLSFSPTGSKGCLAGQTIAFMDVNGDVMPCSYLPISAGNAYEKKFQDIWENATLLNSFRSYSEYKGRCGSCEYIKVCGGCRARAHVIHEDFLAEEPFCDYVPNKRKNNVIDNIYPSPMKMRIGGDVCR